LLVVECETSGVVALLLSIAAAIREALEKRNIGLVMQWLDGRDGRVNRGERGGER
jgi:hypothetical protein